MCGEKIVTSRDIAKIAGVSQATVSRTFNCPDKVDSQTRGKILEVAKKMDYTPNAIAKSLVSSRTNVIGAVIEDFENPFYVSFVHKLAEKLANNEKKVLLLPPRANESALQLLQEAQSFRVDGLVVASALLSQQLTEKEIPLSLPVVMINRQNFSDHYCSVASDDVSCGRAIADYFFSKKRFLQFVYVTGNPEKSSSENRQKGYVGRLREWGVSCQNICGDYTYKGGVLAAQRLLERKMTFPVAIFAANDLMAMGIIDEIREHSGYSIPQDISVVGVDNIEQGSWASYNLTTMQLPTIEMIDCAFAYLNSDKASRKKFGGRHLFPCLLVERKTVV
ncbi:MAG: LacI family DNA-binding transcriptional regulator [Sphaerochaetaceae bacterium]